MQVEVQHDGEWQASAVNGHAILHSVVDTHTHTLAQHAVAPVNIYTQTFRGPQRNIHTQTFRGPQRSTQDCKRFSEVVVSNLPLCCTAVLAQSKQRPTFHWRF